MNGNDTRTVGQLLKLADHPAGPPASDQSLLSRVAADADGAAFDDLVRRHGPMVLGVCRRVLGHEQDAEDAFQAVFLVLARKATTVRNGRSVGSWLFGVARHVALRLRDKDRRRRRHEFQAVAGALSAPDDRGGSEAVVALDEEVQRLPERYRVPIVVCHLQGRTQEEAAGELGWSVRTLRRQLDRGRELLKTRLVSRGVAAPAALSASGLTAVVPDALADTTRRVAVAFVSGGEVAAPVAALAKGALAMSTVAKLKVLIGTGFVLGGAAVLWSVAAAALPGPAGPPPTLQPAPTTAQPAPPPAEKDKPRAKAETPEKEKKATADDRIRPGDYLYISANNVFESDPINGLYVVEPNGKVVLGPVYGGRIQVGDLPVEEAERAIKARVRMFAKYADVTIRRYDPVIDGPNLALGRRGRAQPKDEKPDGATADGRIRPGEHLHIRARGVFETDPINGVYAVEPSGKIVLGPAYGGRVKVDGLTLKEAEQAVQTHIGRFAKDATVVLRRYDPVIDRIERPLERRVLELEQEVDDLRAIVEELRKKRP